MYNPAPIDTSGIEVPTCLQQLTEKLSKNVHEVWAAERIREGWHLGPKRDDSKRETPCLIPYEELSEEEKSYDRNTAIETIKLILALGYQITE